MLVKKNELVFLPSKTEDSVHIKELGSAVLNILGSIFINRICGITCKVNDGNRAILEGRSIGMITSPLSQSDTSADEIEAFKPQNKALRKLIRCPVVDRRVQTLIGIQHDSFLLSWFSACLTV